MLARRNGRLLTDVAGEIIDGAIDLVSLATGHQSPRP
jgi:hypothetical protein